MILCCLPILAQADWYQVEILIFEQSSANQMAAGRSVMWKTALPRSDRVQLLLDSPGSSAPQAYQVLPSSQYRLHGGRRLLGKAKNYHPLMHVAWRQPAISSARAVSIRMVEGELLTQSRADLPRFTEPLVAGPAVDGTIRISSAHFLHAEVDLVYYPARYAPPRANAAGGGEQTIPIGSLRLQESRKIRLKELHYFDHPSFGLLLQLRRLGQ